MVLKNDFVHFCTSFTLPYRLQANSKPIVTCPLLWSSLALFRVLIPWTKLHGVTYKFLKTKIGGNAFLFSVVSFSEVCLRFQLWARRVWTCVLHLMSFRMSADDLLCFYDPGTSCLKISSSFLFSFWHTAYVFLTRKFYYRISADSVYVIDNHSHTGCNGIVESVEEVVTMYTRLLQSRVKPDENLATMRLSRDKLRESRS